MSEVRDWLTRLYGKSPGYWTAVFFDRGKPKHTKWYATDDKSLSRAARTIDHYADQFDIYASVGTWAEPAERGRGMARDVISLAALWSDLDIGTVGHNLAADGLPNPATEEQALSILDGLPAASAVIHSGGGLQAWHFFDEPYLIEDNATAAGIADGWQQRLIHNGAEKGFHVDSVGDLARILRVPGTRNFKGVTDGMGYRPVTLYAAPGETYPLAELAALGFRPESGSVQLANRSADDIQESVDTFPLSWREIMEPHGWTFGKRPRHDGAEFLWRPGKSVRTEGHSAVVNPYGIPVLVNFSGTSGLPTGADQRLTKLRVYALLNHDGDVKAARLALARLFPATNEQLAKVVEKFAYSKIDWPTLWVNTPPDTDWLVPDFIEAGRQLAVFSEAKVGKSILFLEIAMFLALGIPMWGSDREVEPLDVLYIDKENTQADLYLRGHSFGVAGKDIPRLHYYSFPELGWLDSPAGGRELHELSRATNARLVIVDTISRMVEGGEQDNDTYHDFYKHTGVLFKGDGTSLVRLDHSGKDSSKGQRGASSKTTDVDAVWRMWRVRTDPNDDMYEHDIQIDRTLTRSNVGPSTLHFYRGGTPLRHVPWATYELGLMVNADGSIEGSNRESESTTIDSIITAA